VSTEPATSSDAGAAAERTALAWRRTALGVVVGGVVALRVTGPLLGAAAAVAAVTGSLLAAAAWWLTGHRYRSARRSVQAQGDLDAAVALVAVSVAATLIGALAVAFVLAR
jgi:uncharacterized membrane protein YidH (DUF202 family)